MQSGTAIGNVARNRSGVTVFATALVGILCQGSAVLAAASYDTDWSYNKSGPQYLSSNNTDTKHVSFSSAPGGDYITLGQAESFAGVSVHADAGSLNMGMRAFAQSMPQSNFFTEAKIYTDAANRVTVLPGTSGLNAGDPIVLKLRVRLDGTLRTEARSWPAASWAHTDISADLSIHDYSVVIDTGEGTYSPTLASFGASARLEAYHVSKPHWGYSYAAPWSERWVTRGNINPQFVHDLSGKPQENSEGMLFPAGRTIDTGDLTVEFLATVGNTLDIDASFSAYVNASNDASAWAEFDNTLAFDVTSDTPGVQMNWAVVPEPTCLAPLILGSLALLRRKP